MPEHTHNDSSEVVHTCTNNVIESPWRATSLPQKPHRCPARGRPCAATCRRWSPGPAWLKSSAPRATASTCPCAGDAPRPMQYHTKSKVAVKVRPSPTSRAPSRWFNQGCRAAQTLGLTTPTPTDAPRGGGSEGKRSLQKRWFVGVDTLGGWARAGRQPLAHLQ